MYCFICYGIEYIHLIPYEEYGTRFDKKQAF